jgi:hypothetical protein
MSRSSDPVSLEILWTRLVTIVHEAAALLVRASFSTISRASKDLACLLLDAEAIRLPSRAGVCHPSSAAFLTLFGTLWASSPRKLWSQAMSL